MESQNNKAITGEDTGMSELELSQLREITGGICESVIIKDGHVVKFPNIPETQPRIL
jgi:hypothetical protein